QKGNTLQVDLIAGRVEDMVDLDRVAGVESDAQRASALLGADDTRLRTDRDRLVTQTRPQPRLQLQSPLRPEAGVERLALGVRQAAIPARLAPYALKEGIDPRPVRSGECWRIVTMAHMYCARPRFREQRGAFERALPSAYDEDALVRESVGCGAVAGERAEFGRDQCRQFVGDVGKRSETEGEQYPLRRQHCTIVQARLETTVALVESRDTQRPRRDV